MTTSRGPTHHDPQALSRRPSIGRLVQVGALAGAIAAACTTAAAAVASAADAQPEVDGRAIPIVAFTWWTIVGAALGVVLARVLRLRRRFVVATTAAAALSLIPAMAAPDDIAARALLVATHLLAAAIIIPPLSRQLAVIDNDRPLARPGPDGTGDGHAPG